MLRRTLSLAYLPSYRSEHGELARQSRFPSPVAAGGPAADERELHGSDRSVIARTVNYFRLFDSLPFKLGDPICFRGCFCSRSSLARRRSPLLENFWIPFRKVFGAIHLIRGPRCIVEEQQ